MLLQMHLLQPLHSTCTSAAQLSHTSCLSHLLLMLICCVLPHNRELHGMLRHIKQHEPALK
jgi:hypothetical protein